MHDTIFKRGRHTRGLRNACRKAVFAAAGLILSAPVFAQDYPNGLSTDSVRPDLDSIFIRDMRKRLEQTRRREKRPTVALVLSGGGAKGAAHLGAKKVIDEVGLPIDVICGTSIGGLVGGMFALGYDSSYIEEIMKSQDWGITLTDRIQPGYIPFENKQYKATYLMSIPFHYEKEVFEQRIHDQIRYSGLHHKDSLKLGARPDDAANFGSNTIASSLPSGYVFGFNINNLISSLTVGYQDSIAFKDLPIPFFCVASDLVSCKAKNWGSGSLNKALKSTMSIPGLFDPERTEGMVLVDGGTRNNFPVDLARAMGADIIIGVDLSDPQPNYSQINNIGDIFSQFISMLMLDSFKKNKDICDVFIKPEISEYNMLSFSREAIETMVERGYEAADAHRKELTRIKAMMHGTVPDAPSARKAIDISSQDVLVNGIVFNGLSDRESLILMKDIGLEAGHRMSAADIHDAMSKIQSSGSFESVSYSLLGEAEPFRLCFNCVKGPINQFGIGFRADSQDLVAMAMNVGLGTHKLAGSALDMNFKIGRSSYADLRYYCKSPWLPTVNLQLRGGKHEGDLFAPGRMSVSYRSLVGRLYLSNINWKNVDLKAGSQYRSFFTREDWLLNAPGSSFILPESARNGRYLGLFVDGSLYTLNRKYYPTKGINLGLRYEWDMIKPGSTSFIPTHRISMDYTQVWRINRTFCLIPDIHLATIFDTNSPELFSMAKCNYVGGFRPGQYIGHQVTFCGLNEAYMARNVMTTVNLEMRARILKNIYASATVGIMKDADTVAGMIESFEPTILGGALQIGYNTVLGPIRANVHWSDLAGWQGFVSMGFDF